MVPQLLVDTGKLRENAEAAIGLAASRRISVMAVTKGFCALPEIARVLAVSGATALADSRTENLAKLDGIDLPKVLLRLPSPSRAAETVAIADISLNSELRTIRALSEAARTQGKKHGIILMVELGDLREGLPEEGAVEAAKAIQDLGGVELLGVGANFTCFGGVIPTAESLGRLAAVGRAVEAATSQRLRYVSGGSSSSYYLLEKGELPGGINSLRLGEVILLGRETAYGRQVEGLHPDAFTLRAEIIELQRKPSAPRGPLGLDAFGETRRFQDRGERLRAILALGRQDAAPEQLRPRLEGAKILGASSDHLIVDLGDAQVDLQVGSILDFDLSYGSLLSLSTSPYIEKKIASPV